MVKTEGKVRRIGLGLVHESSQAYTQLAHEIRLKGGTTSTHAKNILTSNGLSGTSNLMGDLRFQIGSGRFEVKTGTRVEYTVYRQHSIFFDATQDPEEIDWRINNLARIIDNQIHLRVTTAPKLAAQRRRESPDNLNQ